MPQTRNDCHAFVEKLIRYGQVAQSASRFHAGAMMLQDVGANSYASRGISRGMKGGLAGTASELYHPAAGVSGFQDRLVQYGQGSWAKAHIQGVAGAMLIGWQSRIDQQFAEDRTAAFTNQIRQINGAGNALGWSGRTVTRSTWIRGVPGLNKALAAVSAVTSAVTIGAKAMALHEHCSKEAGL